MTFRRTYELFIHHKSGIVNSVGYYDSEESAFKVGCRLIRNDQKSSTKLYQSFTIEEVTRVSVAEYDVDMIKAFHIGKE